MKALHLKIAIGLLLAPVAQLAAQSAVQSDSLSRQLDEIAALSAVEQEEEGLILRVTLDGSKPASRVSFVEGLPVYAPGETEYHAIRDERMAMYAAARSYHAEKEAGKDEDKPKDLIAARAPYPSVSDFAIAAASGLPGHYTLIIHGGKSRQARWPVLIAVSFVAEALSGGRWPALLYFSLRQGYASGAAATLSPSFTSSALPPLTAVLQLDRPSRIYLSFFDVPTRRNVFFPDYSFGGIV